MKIESVRIENFRAIKDQTIPFADYTCLVGPNGAGKSSILTALNILFRCSTDSATNLLALEEEDFHKKDTKEPIKITATFTELTPEAQTDFAHYYRQGKLILSAVAKWDAASNKAPVLQFGQRLGFVDFAPFFEAEGGGAKVEQLKSMYEGIRPKYASLPPPGTKAAMIDALRGYEDCHSTECVLLPSEDQFYGCGPKAKNLLEKYIQWVFIPAVKDASSEQLEARRTAFGQLLERTVRSKMSFAEPLKQIRDEAFSRYRQLLDEYAENLEELAQSLTERLQEWAHPDARIRLSWQSDASHVTISDPIAELLVGEGIFEGHLPRFGHGLQRSFLLALLQELASAGIGGGPTLVLACEEPELYQHPPQIRHLVSVFDELTSQGTQVIVCTHNPSFVRGEQFEEIRLVTKDRRTSEAVVRHLSFDSIASEIAKAGGRKPPKSAGTALKVSQALQPTVNEMFFTPVLVLVEGLEDATYISSYLVLADLWQDFRRIRGHIVRCQGKNSMILPVAIAKGLQIPSFVVFDADTDQCGQPDKRIQHETDNSTLLNLCGKASATALPTDHIWEDDLVAWKENITAALSRDVGDVAWNGLRNRVKDELELADVSNVYKNSSFIQKLMSSAWDEGTKFPSLERVCQAILRFAKSHTYLEA